MSDLVHRVVGLQEGVPACPRKRTPLQRLLGENNTARADQQPPHPTPAAIGPLDPTPSTSEADLEHHQVHPESEDHVTDFDTVQTMWKRGLKTEACQHMLFSDFAYSDFVRLLQTLPSDQAQEMGDLLDRMAPEYNGASGDKGIEAFLRKDGAAEDRRSDLEATGQLA